MNIWNHREYYEKIAATENFSHPGFKLAQRYCQTAKNILDVGCGDGSKLARLGNQRTKRIGCDISKEAVILGKQEFPGIKFDQFDDETLPYKTESFDRVTSFFVLEHTDNPDNLITEMIHVLALGGYLILLAPNFGAPNRASPNFKGNRLVKMIGGVLDDFLPARGLGWNHVTPKITTIEEFESDLDTTVEPYLGSLWRFLQIKELKIVETKSFWEMERPGAKALQRGLRFLGEREIYPFRYWGPHLFVVAEKI